MPHPKLPKLQTYPQVIHRPGFKTPGRPPFKLPETPSANSNDFAIYFPVARERRTPVQEVLEFGHKKRGEKSPLYRGLISGLLLLFH